MVKDLWGSVALLGVLLLFYSVIAFPLALLIYFLGRKAAGWLKSEIFLIFIPWCIWILLMLFASTGKKSLSNVVEVFFCGIPAGFILLPRLFLPSNSNRSKIVITALSTLVASSIVVLIWLLTPSLAE